jgi:heparanase 1
VTPARRARGWSACALARELAPAYLRVGGSEADRTHYDMSGAAGPADAPPAPFEWTLTRAEWDAVNDFARALDFPVLFTVNAGPGVRDAALAWQPAEARELLAYTRDKGYRVALWELGNEVNGFPIIHGIDFSITGGQLAKDLHAFRGLVNELTPGVAVGAPSSAFWPVAGEFFPIVQQLLEAGGGADLDVLTWHYYPLQSRRCPVAVRRADLDLLFDPSTLDEIDRWAGLVEGLRDAHAPQLPIWLGESGNAQCGGEPDLSDAFAGGFWWLDELGKVARRGQKVLVRQTLSGSNYGLLDDATLEPRPDYWTSVLYKRLMGTRVLDARSPDPLLRVYAQCARDAEPGAVAYAVVNLDRERAADLTLPAPAGGDARVFELTADSLTSKTMKLGGAPLALAADGSLPPLAPRVERASGDGSAHVRFAPASYGFVVIAGAAAAACR